MQSIAKPSDPTASGELLQGYGLVEQVLQKHPELEGIKPLEPKYQLTSTINNLQYPKMYDIEIDTSSISRFIFTITNRQGSSGAIRPIQEPLTFPYSAISINRSKENPLTIYYLCTNQNINRPLKPDLCGNDGDDEGLVIAVCTHESPYNDDQHLGVKKNLRMIFEQIVQEQNPDGLPLTDEQYVHFQLLAIKKVADLSARQRLLRQGIIF